MTTTATETQTFRYRAAGFTEDITECDICGKVDLKGTVRLVIVDADGNEDGEVYAGVVCAARRSGRKAAEIRTEAAAGDRAVCEAWSQYRQALASADYAASGRALTRLGLQRSLASITITDADPQYRAELAAWKAEHPAPPAPPGW